MWELGRDKRAAAGGGGIEREKTDQKKERGEKERMEVGTTKRDHWVMNKESTV